MYLYGFTLYAGNDKVVKYEHPEMKISVGDLLKSENEYFLALGDEVSFPELYTTHFFVGRSLEVIYPHLLGKKTIALLHWMVYTWYSTYKNVLKYFLNEDILSLLHRETKKKKTTKIAQNLYIFPDLWTLQTSIAPELLVAKDTAVLSSQSSPQKKDATFWGVKHGTISTLYTTHAEVFQDFANLQSIVLVDPHARYYTNQQDPRYKIPAVVEEIKRLWGIV